MTTRQPFNPLFELRIWIVGATDLPPRGPQRDSCDVVMAAHHPLPPPPRLGPLFRKSGVKCGAASGSGAPDTAGGGIAWGADPGGLPA